MQPALVRVLILSPLGCAYDESLLIQYPRNSLQIKLLNSVMELANSYVQEVSRHPAMGLSAGVRKSLCANGAAVGTLWRVVVNPQPGPTWV